MTPQEVWLLVDYRKNKGKPKIKPMTSDRMQELEAMIAEKEANRV